MADQPAAAAAAADPAAGAADGQGGAAPANAGSGGSDRTFTQADVDRIIEQRLERQRSQFKDYDELKTKAKQFDELEQSKQSETEKALAAIEKASREAQEAREREQAATTRANETLIRAEVVAEAAKQHAVDPQDVFGLLDKSKVTIQEDGTVTGAADAVKELLEAKPHLVQRPQGGSFDGGARGAPPAGPQMNDLIRRAAGVAPNT